MVQDNAAQQWWYSTILVVNTISNTGKFAKMVHPDFFLVKMVVKFSSLWLWKSMIAGSRLWWRYWQSGKPSILPCPFPYIQHTIITSIAFCQPLLMHHLHSTFIKVKKEDPQRELNTDQRYSLTVFTDTPALTGCLQRLLIFNIILLFNESSSPNFQPNYSPKNYDRDMHVIST